MSREHLFLREVARHHDLIRTGAVAFDYRTGQCGPVQATVTKSWGAACPTGFCPPDNLPEALGRWFAGDRAGCREMPWTVTLEGTQDAAADVTLSATETALITMCPTRLLINVQGTGTDEDFVTVNTIQFGIENQLVGGPVPVTAFHPQAFQMVPFVPSCIKAGQPFTISATIAPDAAVADYSVSFVFIGPMVG
jgi:hypothetical protein